MSLQSLECAAYGNAHKLVLCTKLDKAHSFPSAIPQMDLLAGVLEPLAEAAVAAEAGAESVVIVAVAILPLVDVA